MSDDPRPAKAGIVRQCMTMAEADKCPNMKPVEGDMDMEYERYECKVCGRRFKLDYEEMR